MERKTDGAGAGVVHGQRFSPHVHYAILKIAGYSPNKRGGGEEACGAARPTGYSDPWSGTFIYDGGLAPKVGHATGSGDVAANQTD